MPVCQITQQGKPASFINHDANLQLRALASGRAPWHQALLDNDPRLQSRAAQLSQHTGCRWSRDLRYSW